MFLQIIHLFLHLGMFSIVLCLLVDDVLVTVAKVSLIKPPILAILKHCFGQKLDWCTVYGRPAIETSLAKHKTPIFMPISETILTMKSVNKLSRELNTT